MGSTMMNFEFPYLAILLFLPIILWKLLSSNRNVNDDTIPKIIFPNIERLKASFSVENKQSKSKIGFIILLSLLWFFLVISVMHPRLLGEIKYNQYKGYEIMLAVDMSESMNVLDFSTKNPNASRLDIAKEVIGNFAKSRSHDRLGLIVFGEYAYLQVPMTFDSMALSQILNNDLVGIAGFSTSIGDAIGLAVKELRTQSGDTRILILLTDGADTSSNIPPLVAAEIARKNNVKIYTIGIGSDSEVSYKDPKGKIAKIKLVFDTKEIEEIAKITGGEYFYAKDDIDLAKIYAKINELEKTDLIATHHQARSLYRYPLGIACILFALICLMPLYNRGKYGI